MSNRKRINISVDEDLYNWLQSLKDKYGFKNVCELNVSLLRVTRTYLDEAEQRSRQAAASATDHDEIIEMFNDLGDWEETPTGVVPMKKHPAKTINDGKR